MTGARVTAKRRIAQDAVELELSPEESGALDWTAGAHIAVQVDGYGRRPYSLCGRPGEPHLTISVRDTGGAVSGALNHRVEVGDHVEIGSPVNSFPLGPHDNYVFVAGGIGITPILPMIDAAEEAGRSWRLVYSARSATRMPYRERFLGDGRAQLFTDGAPDLSAVLRSVPPGTGVYGCGPATMLTTLRTLAAQWGSAAELRVEAFTPAPESVSIVDPTEFTVRVGEDGEPLPVGPWDCVLDVLEGAGFEVESSCRAGICGTCEVKVLRGTPDHRDDVLTDDERAQGTTMLPCVSRSLSDELVVALHDHPVS